MEGAGQERDPPLAPVEIASAQKARLAMTGIGEFPLSCMRHRQCLRFDADWCLGYNDVHLPEHPTGPMMNTTIDHLVSPLTAKHEQFHDPPRGFLCFSWSCWPSLSIRALQWRRAVEFEWARGALCLLWIHPRGEEQIQ
jgi:hypothetical protein